MYVFWYFHDVYVQCLSCCYKVQQARLDLGGPTSGVGCKRLRCKREGGIEREGPSKREGLVNPNSPSAGTSTFVDLKFNHIEKTFRRPNAAESVRRDPSQRLKPCHRNSCLLTFVAYNLCVRNGCRSCLHFCFRRLAFLLPLGPRR